MYPLLRLALAMAGAVRHGPLAPDAVHVSRHVCLPWDLDPFLELNNGRFLTLFDLGRLPLAQRTGIVRGLRRAGLRFTMAGATVRWRRRVRLFDRFEMRSRAVGRDARFFYIEQTMWRQGECLCAALYRVAVAGPAGIVPTAEVVETLGWRGWDPPLPVWVAAWAETENARPWPPPR
jgi:acyl-CoA thioesterase FadM